MAEKGSRSLGFQKEETLNATDRPRTREESKVSSMEVMGDLGRARSVEGVAEHWGQESRGHDHK